MSNGQTPEARAESQARYRANNREKIRAFNREYSKRPHVKAAAAAREKAARPVRNAARRERYVPKTHCKNGHSYADNTLERRVGNIRCAACAYGERKPLTIPSFLLSEDYE